MENAAEMKFSGQLSESKHMPQRGAYGKACAPALAHVYVVHQSEIQPKQPPAMWQAEGVVALLLHWLKHHMVKSSLEEIRVSMSGAHALSCLGNYAENSHFSLFFVIWLM